MKPTIWVFGLEPLDSRYTQQWYTHIPEVLAQAAGDRFSVRQIAGVQRDAKVTAGAFLNFTDTNYWKSTQLCEFIRLFDAGEVGPDDRLLFTDTWNPAILQVRYMCDLMDQRWVLHGIWHAGAYDPTDILGMKMHKPWPWHTEAAMFTACDYNYYATEFHMNMFLENLDIHPEEQYRAVRSGQPHGLIVEAMQIYQNIPKSTDNYVMWPHRYNADKQPEIAEDLSQHFHMIITQKHNFSKAEYYQKLSESRVIFSCALHENLGISIMEAVLARVIPVLPDRCSYTEMYDPVFLYPSDWTRSLAEYENHKLELMGFIQDRINNYDQYLPALEAQRQRLIADYLNADVMIGNLTQ
jgi:hypothetical protein